MLRLECKKQTYAWGKPGSQSIVGRIAKANDPQLEESKEFEETPYAEYWMGDHVNGPSQFAVDADSCSWLGEDDFVSAHSGQTVCLSELV